VLPRGIESAPLRRVRQAERASRGQRLVLPAIAQNRYEGGKDFFVTSATAGNFAQAGCRWSASVKLPGVQSSACVLGTAKIRDPSRVGPASV
jgi:hypothetical protein